MADESAAARPRKTHRMGDPQGAVSALVCARVKRVVCHRGHSARCAPVSSAPMSLATRLAQTSAEWVRRLQRSAPRPPCRPSPGHVEIRASEVTKGGNPAVDGRRSCNFSMIAPGVRSEAAHNL